jgi:phosphate:Na+ symporter
VIPLLEKLSYRLVKEEPAEVDKYQEKFEALNPNFFNTPAIALNSCYDLLLTQFQLAKKNIHLAYGLLSDYDEAVYNEIQEDEVYIDRFADRISAYLVALLPHLKDDQHTAILDEYYRVFTEFERLGDHAVNISDNARSLADKNMAFSATAMGDLDVMMTLLKQILDETEQAFKKRDINAAYRIQPLRKVAADMVLELKESHLARMGHGTCNVFLDPNFENLLSDMIRIADVSSNVGEAVIVRVRPEVASREHTYFADLRHENEDYNRIYQDARKQYFDMLPENEYGEAGSYRKNSALPQFNDA